MHKRFTRILLPLLAITFVTSAANAQLTTNTEVLRQAALQENEKEKRDYDKLLTLAREKGWDLVIKGPNGSIAILSSIDRMGYPIYTSTDNNILAAATIGTNKLYPGGGLGLALTGASIGVKNKLAVWDGGKVRNTHVELTGRVVQRDNVAAISDHATHVSGTLIASGVNANAKGMSYGQQELVAYDFSNDNSEMLTEAANLLVSNHSYGEIAGWFYNDAQSRWEFRGRSTDNEDYKMGYYSDKSQLWDSIAFNAPYYLIVKSSGNKRNENGPAEGQNYWRYNASGVMSDAGPRPPGISSNNSFDIIPTYGVAKNILTVGAVNPIASGYSKPADVAISTFSSWGPTDDGRIKPDVVADGVNLLSSIGTADNAYDIYSGTSMSTPSASGSLLLLQEYYAQLHAGTFMRASTLKGLVIHTANEAGTAPGPDYQHGWGLINMPGAAAVIGSNNTFDRISESILNNGATFTQTVVASGRGPLVATLSWTDPKGSVITDNNPAVLNNTTKRLVHDLDVVIKKGATVFRSWKLDPANPSAAATRGDNITDNVEKVVVDDVVPGETYTIEITHKGSLERSLQAYSLILSGVNGQAYCSSAATNTAGARIDSVSFGTGIRKQNPAGCTSYTNYTTITETVEPNQAIPVFIRLNSCDATSTDKIVKAFIDYNNDGDFTDAGEEILTSGVINGDGNFTGTITTPATMPVNNFTILRIVAVETNNAASVVPCGSYVRGETQDYRLQVLAPSTDLGIAGLVSPSSANCAEGAQYLSIRVRNFGRVAKTAIPLTATVRQGATVIATLTATYPGTIGPLTEVTYTFQAPFVTVANTTYSVTMNTGLSGDQNLSNNEIVVSFTTGAATAAPTGTAEICGTASVSLSATNPVLNAVYNWYDALNATTPLASGVTATSTVITPNNTYYLGKNEVAGKLGPVNKGVLGAGGYNVFSGNFIKFTNNVPLTLETVKLYTRAAGRINFIIANLSSFNSTTGAYSYIPLASTLIDVYSTSPNPAAGAQNDDPADQGARFYLGLPVVAPGEHILIAQCQDGASLFRNNGVATNPYPFTIPGVMSITSNSAVNTTTPSDVNYYQRFYYFYYDMAVSIAGCPSPRTTIVATTSPTPVISITGNALSSSLPSGNLWHLNGVAIAGASAQTFTATAPGVYKVINTSASGCVLSSNEITFSITSVPNVDPSAISMTISPNPTKREFVLQLETRTKDDLEIALLSTSGQQVYQRVIPGFIGRLNQRIDPGHLAPGVYYLRVQHDKKAYNRKLVVVP